MNTTYPALAVPANHRFHPLYEDFRPSMETGEDPKAKTVHIHLPGFVKEHVRIVAESSRRILRVRGERLIGGNRWIRFLEEVPVPENCEMAGITAKFEREFLRISMPIKMATAPQIETPVPEIPHPKPQFAPETLEEDEAERGKEDEKQIGRENPSEEIGEGKMLMNVGVAAVVIVALGSWISYSSIAASSASSII